MTKGLLVYNLAAGSLGEDLLPKLIAELGEVETISLKELGEPSRVVDLAREKGCAWVAAAGGDGTVEAVATALLGGDLPLGVIPVGTYNNFARSLLLPLDPLAACRVIHAGSIRPMDAGIANGKPFFECAGLGLDAALFPYGEDIKSGNFSRMLILLRRAFFYRPRRFTFTLDRPLNEALRHGDAHESKRLACRLERVRRNTLTLSALMVSASNGPLFGMNFAVAPDARVDDGLLTISIFHRYNKLDLLWHFLSIARGNRVYAPKTITLRVAKASISANRRTHVHLDGTPAPLWPLEVECRPAALRVFRPPAD